MDALIQSLFVWAVTLTGYTDPGSLPEVSAVSKTHLAESVCEGDYCTAVAYYDSDSQTIFYDERMELAEDHGARGFIVHEMVHYLQHQHGILDDDSDCENRVLLEREAYRVQQYFLQEHKQDTFQIDLAVAVLPSLCAEQDGEDQHAHP